VAEEADRLFFAGCLPKMMIPDLTLRMNVVYRQQTLQPFANHAGYAIGSLFVVGMAVLIAEIHDELQLLIEMRLDEFRDGLMSHSGFAFYWPEAG